MKGDISALLPAGTLLFTAYGDDYLKVQNRSYTEGLYIHHNTITSPWGPSQLHDLSIEHLAPLTASAPEVLILGTGRNTRFPSEAILNHMAALHIGFECMDTRAACRTYNILVGEGRTVSAAMLLPGARA